MSAATLSVPAPSIARDALLPVPQIRQSHDLHLDPKVDRPQRAVHSCPKDSALAAPPVRCPLPAKPRHLQSEDPAPLPSARRCSDPAGRAARACSCGYRPQQRSAVAQRLRWCPQRLRWCRRSTVPYGPSRGPAAPTRAQWSLPVLDWDAYRASGSRSATGTRGSFRTLQRVRCGGSCPKCR